MNFPLKIFIILFVSFSFLFANKKEFKVSYDPDYAPFSYLEEDEPVGLLIDYWKYWADKNDYKLEFVNGKLWDDAINLVKDEKVDFFLGTYPYEDWMKGSKTFYSTQTSLFIHKDNSKGYSKNAAYVIAIIGSDYKEHIEENFPNSEIIIYDDYKTVFKDFLDKKIDLIYDDKIAIEFYALRNNYFHQIRSIELLNNTPDIKAIAKDENLVKIFNEGLSKLTYEELYDIENKWIINKEHRYYKVRDLSLSKEELDFIKNSTINVSISKDWKPFNFAQDNKPTGISYEIWELITNKTALKSKYTIYDRFTQQIEAIKSGKEDIIYSVGETKERKDFAIFSEKYYSFPISIATLKDENFIENISLIFDKRIAVGENFTAHKMLKERYPNLDLLLVSSIEQGLKAVSQKKAYAYVDIKPNLDYNIKKHSFNDIKISGNSGLTFDLSIMIRKDLPILKSILDKTITSIDKDEIAQIISKWENIQFEKNDDYTKIFIVLGVSFLLIIIVLVKEFKTSRENKKLEILVDERTKDLKELTQTLEQKVDEKTKELTKVNYILDEAQKIAQLGSFQYNFKKDKLIFSDALFKMLDLDKNVDIPSFDLALSYVYPEDKDKVLKILKKALQSKNHVTLEFRIIVNKEIKYIQSSSKITKYDENNRPTLFIGTLLDLTKVKRLENEKREKDTILAQQSKMAAMGEMLENIAHQWRQPLSVISTASTGLQIKLEINQDIPKDVLLENVITINQQTQYLSKTIEDFRNFFNPKKVKYYFRIKNSIEKSIHLIRTQLKSKNVTVVDDIENIEIYGLENELIQVFLNIINNAIDAFLTQKQNFIFIKTYKDKNNLIIEIKDNAGGINPKIIDRIFEPYFTTKHKSQGTGIGLYMSNEIITKHLYGEINVTNKSYVYDNINCFGANFKITIPIKSKEEMKN